ncbi:MAG: transporter substrate-binding domain-containing protein [Alphaproteobacteria bacterium]|nr:transporter substrate-binding domain-containing protein [Alphaproteobacteria bacterium]
MFRGLGIALVAVLLSSPALAGDVTDRVLQTKTIRCGYFVAPPYFDKAPNTQTLSGINYEIMEAVGKRLGLAIAWVAEIGIGDIVTGLETNKIDAMCATLWPNPPRVQTMSFSAPLFYSPVHAYARADDRRFDNGLDKANAPGISISAIDADFSYDLAKEKFPRASIKSLPPSASVSDVMLQVTTNKADLVMMDRGTANGFSKANNGRLKAVPGVAPIQIYPELVFLKRGEFHLRDIINSALDQLKNDGFIEQTINKYNGTFDSDYLFPTKDFSSSPKK